MELVSGKDLRPFRRGACWQEALATIQACSLWAAHQGNEAGEPRGRARALAGTTLADAAACTVDLGGQYPRVPELQQEGPLRGWSSVGAGTGSSGKPRSCSRPGAGTGWRVKGLYAQPVRALVLYTHFESCPWWISTTARYNATE